MKVELKKHLQIINKNFDILQQIYFVKKIGVFGSLVKGTHNKKSDIDIIVEFSQPMGFFKFIELENFLEKTLRRKVDLTTKKALKSAIKKEILKNTIYV